MSEEPINDYCMYDNPITMRRELWINKEKYSSVSCFIIRNKATPMNFSNNWKRPWNTSSFIGNKDHLPFETTNEYHRRTEAGRAPNDTAETA